MRSARSVKATRFATVFAIAALALPAAVGPTAGADPVIFTAGTTQDFDSSNPYQTALVSGYEAFQLSFDLLVGFGLDTKPIPGFADKWTRNPDNVTFHIRTGMKWSDGQPATSADACFSWQLALDAHAANASIGLGYLDTGVSDAGVTKVSCPDPETMIAYTTDQSDRIYQVYLPIVPQHIYGKDNYKTIGDEPFNAPLVGTGPYQLAEWKTGQFMRFTRNPNYWGTQGFADEIVLQIFSSSDTMVQALKKGDLQYARGVNAQQLNELKTAPNIQTVVGAANGWSQLAFNVYGTGTGKTIDGGGPSTQALLDPKFRDALGYAIDKKTLVDRVLGGYGDVGSTIVPPVLGDMHVEPAQPRTFDIELAKQKLDAAGYPLDANGKRLDKQGKPIVLRLVMPDSDANYPKAAEFIKDWYGQLGIELQTAVYDSNTLTDLLLPPEAGGKTNKAKYDIELWGWSGNPDPNGLLDVFLCKEIGSLSDSNFCDPAYDTLYAQEIGAVRGRAECRPQDDAEHDLRPRGLRHPVLRLEPGRLSNRQVHGPPEHAGERHAAVLVRNVQLHPAEGRDRRPDAWAERGGRLGGTRDVVGTGDAGTERDARQHLLRRRQHDAAHRGARRGRPGRDPWLVVSRQAEVGRGGRGRLTPTDLRPPPPSSIGKGRHVAALPCS